MDRHIHDVVSGRVQSGDQVYVPQKSWLARNGGIFLWGWASVGVALLVHALTQ